MKSWRLPVLQRLPDSCYVSNHDDDRAAAAAAADDDDDIGDATNDKSESTR